MGDCVYVQPSEANLQPHIVCIEKLWKDEAGVQNPLFFFIAANVSPLFADFLFFFCINHWMCLFSAGEQWMYGGWFYRPGETFHLATRKFLEKEVFKSDYYSRVPFSKILGKCVVLFVKVSNMRHIHNMF